MSSILPGLRNLPIVEYHHGEGISKSGLDLIAKAPAAYRYAQDFAQETPPTAAQRIGSAVHTAVLEAKEFSSRYTRELTRQDRPFAIDDRETLIEMIDTLNADRLPKLPIGGSKQDQIERILTEIPGHSAESLEKLKANDLKALLTAENERRPGHVPKTGNRHELADLLRTHGVSVQLWSDERAAWETQNAGKIALSEAEWDLVDGMSVAVYEHSASAALLQKQGVIETSAFWRDPRTGVLCKCRPDFWVPETGLVVDLKTTDDASPEGFARSILKWRYHVQAAFYLDGLNHVSEQAELHIPKQKHFTFIVVEKKPPHLVAVYVLDQDSIDLGRQVYRENLDTYAGCLRSGIWPGYPEKITTVSLPEWHIKKYLHQEEAL